jgi:hypothetical protein
MIKKIKILHIMKYTDACDIAVHEYNWIAYEGHILK